MTPSRPSGPLGDRLAYIGIGAEDVAAWDRFARAVLGLHITRTDDGGLRLRLDEKAVRFLVHPAESGYAYFGWEIPDGTTLDDAVDRLEQHAVEWIPGTAAELAARHVADMCWFTDPLGNRVELCAGHAVDPEPLRLTRPLAGFKTGAGGLGHAVLMGREVEEARRFYLDVFGMRLSDYADSPFDAQFFHVNRRHHSFAIIKNDREGLHHVMVELLELDDVGQTYDLLESNGVQLGASMGRHTNDYMTSFYMFTPSRFMIEYGVGGREIDPETWSAERLDCGPSFWGHERTWLAEPMRTRAFELRLQAAREGLKAKLVVTPGHFVQAGQEENP